MKKLEFYTVGMEGFKEFREWQSLKIGKLPLGIIFVKGINEHEPRLGSNGAGKSSIFDAIMWCLYGRTAHGLRGTDIRTWGEKKHAYVKLVMYIDDVKEVLERSTETNGLWLNGKVVAQETIDQLVGLSHTMACNSIMMGQKAELFFDLTSGKKLELLTDALQLDRWTDYSKSAADRVKTYEGEIIKISATISEMNRTADDVEADIRSATEKSKAWDAENRTSAAANTKLLREGHNSLKQWQAELGDADLAYDGAETELRAAQAAMDKARRKLDEETTRYAEASATLNAEDGRLYELQDHLANLTDSCPSCGQKLGNAAAQRKHRAELLDKLDAQKRRCDQAYATSNEIADMRDTAQHRWNQCSEDVANYRKKSNDAIDARTRAQARVVEIRAQVEQLEAAKRDAINPYVDVIADQRERLKKCVRLVREAQALWDIAHEKNEAAKYWVPAFKQVRLYLLQEFLEELQDITQDMLPRVGLVDWEVSYSIERETKTGNISTGLIVSIYKPGHSKPIKLDTFSGGEGQRLRVAGALGLSEALLRRAGVACDLIVLDEPTQHMSAEGIVDLIDALADYGRDHQVFYVDHHARNSNRFAGQVTVRRSATGSRLETG